MVIHGKSRSLFWPIILVAAGVILLLRNLEIIPAFSLGSILRLWPLLLVVLGLDILFGRKTPWAGAVIGLLAVAAVVLFLVYGASLGLTTSEQVKTEVFTAPSEQATSVNYYLETAADPVAINALPGTDELINATIVHRGTMHFDVSGTTEKSVRLTESITADSWLVWDLNFIEQKWKIGLNPELPSDITLDGGSGSVNLDLDGLNLASLRASMGSGSSTFTLPGSDAKYSVEIESGSGAVTIKLPGSTPVDLTIESGSGSVNISVPAGAALRVETLDDGSGSFNIPDGLKRTTSTSAGSLGAWQTEGYDQAAMKISIIIRSRGSGSINIH